MSYWFANDPGAMPTLSYDAQQFQADETHLLALVDEIALRTDFPLTPDLNRCAYCVYRSYCGRGEFGGRAGRLGGRFRRRQPGRLRVRSGPDCGD